MAAVWSILFMAAAIALWQHRAWTRFMIPLLLLAHGIYQLGLLSFFSRSNASRNGWLAIGLLLMLALLVSLWALNRSAVRWYFEK